MESSRHVAAFKRRKMRAAADASASPGPSALREPRAPWLDFVRRLYPLALVTAFPVALLSNFWLEVWHGVRPHAPDGSGHWGIAQIYNAAIFPDTFGWTGAYFGGMPFPNFYPPLFHWLVGLLAATRLFSFDSAFKLLLFAPTLLMPAAVGLLASRLSGGRARVAVASASACVLLLVNMRFQTTTCGLDYASTFVAGFYTQPLGFVLLLAWYAAYVRAERSRLRAAASCVLLALTVLANFFNAFTSALLIASTLALGLLNLRAAEGADARAEARRRLVAQLATPLVALALCLFWLAPVLTTYEYFVTRPLVLPLRGLVTPWLLCWYAVAAAGIVLWWRRSNVGESDEFARAYILSLFALAACVAFASTLAPPWFPLQAFRFLSTLNFMLAVPVGVALAAVLDLFKVEVRRPRGAWALARHVSVIVLAVVAIGIFQASRPTGGLAFYSPEDNERLEAVLHFARVHRDGRYLVEVLDQTDNPSHADGPALNAYLGAQGNEALAVVYREASPNSIFFNALASAVSSGKESFGISSVLADDLDFAAQPLARQLERARWLGVRYVVAESDGLKERLAREPTVAARHDLDRWSVFEIGGGEAPRALVLDYRPALVVSDFSVKGRRRNDFDFVRLAEEQFGDGWLDVLLARSTENKIDRLDDLDGFGALVLDRYDCDDEVRAFALLRDFAQRRALVLLASDAPLFQRIRSSLSDFPHAHVVERPLNEPPGERVESFQPSYHYEGSTIRRVWRDVRAALESEKVATVESHPGGAKASVTMEVGRNEMTLAADAPRGARDLPVFIKTTYSPDWRAREGNRIYAATPFFMLTFARGPVHLAYARGALDRAALCASGLTLLSLCCFVFIPRRRGSLHRNSLGVSADSSIPARPADEPADERTAT